MREKLKAFSGVVMRIVRSPRFFYVVIALLVVQASLIALTARYPQAFDENYHFGLIQLHTEHIIPFFSVQPEGGSVYGSLTSDPSYLFHYLMSLPYRLISLVTQDELTQVIVLRFINIGLFVAGLFVYRKLLNELRISTGLRNVALFFFVLLPIVPLVAGQINYDNFMLILAGLMFIYLARFVQKLRGRLPSEPLVPVGLVLQVCIYGGLGSITKYAFAPLFFAALIAMVGLTIFYYRLARYRPKLFTPLATGTSRAKLIGLSVFALLTFALCFERYGMNLIQYHSVVPKCDKVMTIEQCMQYSPWARDHLFNQIYPRPDVQGYVVYPFVWINRMVYETMFTITSYFNPDSTVTYSAKSPQFIGWAAAWIGLAIGAAGAVVYWVRIRLNRPLTVLLGITLFYTLILFIQNLAMYHHSGEAVAIHGRYLVPVFPVLLVCLAIGWKGLLEQFRLVRYQGLVLVALTLLFMQGGGITNWVMHSDGTWYSQDNQAAQATGRGLKSVIDKVVIPWHN